VQRRFFRSLFRRLLPRAGEGPSEELREKGYHTYYAIGTCTGSNTRHVATFTGQKDPGYGGEDT